jgi:hypothetical protein
MVTSLIELVEQVVDLIPSSVDSTLPSESETQVVDPFPSVDPILPLENATQVVDLISPSVDSTLPLERKPNNSHNFFIDATSTMLGEIPPSPVDPPPSNEAIRFDSGALLGPSISSHISFKITVQVCGQDVPQTLIYEGSSISIFSYFSLQALGYPCIILVTQNMLVFNIRTSHPLGVLPSFP